MRRILGDVGASDPAFNTESINRAVERHMRILGNEVWQGPTWVTAGITMVAGTSDYTFPASVEYTQIQDMKLKPIGIPMERRTLEQIERYRVGTSTPMSQPYLYAMWEDTGQLVNIRVYPWPDQAYTIDYAKSVIPAALTAENSLIPFSENLIIGLQYRVAAELMGIAGDEQMSKLALGPNAAALYAGTAERVIRREKERLSRMQTLPFISRAQV